MRFRLIVLAMIAALMVPSVSWAIGIEGAVGVWQQASSGTFEYEGDSLSLEDDFGISDKNTGLIGRLKLDLPGPIPNVYLMGTQMSFDGTATRNFTFGGYNFADVITTELVLDHYDIALYYGLPFLGTLSNDMLNLEAGLNLRVLELNATVTESLTAYQETGDVTAPVPMLYVGLQIDPTDNLGIEFEGRGLSLSGNSYVDFIGRVKYSPATPVFIAGGYRYESITIDADDVKADLTFAGPFVEAGFEF